VVATNLLILVTTVVVVLWPQQMSYEDDQAQALDEGWREHTRKHLMDARQGNRMRRGGHWWGAKKNKDCSVYKGYDSPRPEREALDVMARVREAGLISMIWKRSGLGRKGVTQR
jgi:hypothetical protein